MTALKQIAVFVKSQGTPSWVLAAFLGAPDHPNPGMELVKAQLE